MLDVRRERGRVPGLLRPLAPVDQLLDRRRAGHRVDHDRLAAEWHVLDEARQCRVRDRVIERRRPREQRDPDERPEARGEPCDLDDRSAGDVRDSCDQMRLEGDEIDPVDAADDCPA